PREPRAGVSGGDVADDDARITEGSAAEYHLESLDQVGVAAAVGVEGGPRGRGRGGREVGDDVAATERVDRLLGITDQRHGGVARAGAIEDLPLIGAGVAELD